MGKKARKTRWRALAINSGEHSDSEESNTNSGHQHQLNKSYQPKSFYSKFPYSSQSSPARSRFQNDTKSTRSSSTTSENKITFNEDDYTRITTPRQDVLFKKGYLSKPKTYQTQTSTGNSTISTGNSTGNGTPDHQSADGTEGTDLEYESQFVFPNGFVDQNGIYYINSFEPYPPLVVYNAPYCYPDYHPATARSKRYSTDSMTESTSPHNEETSQDQSQSGGETSAVPADFAHPPQHVFNVVYPGAGYYYSNGVVAATATTPPEAESIPTETRKIKKRRRRKLSKPILDGTSSDEYESDEAVSEIENRIIQGTHRPNNASPVEASQNEEVEKGDSVKVEETVELEETIKVKAVVKVEETNLDKPEEIAAQPEEETKKTSLKPDAKEFIPRAFQNFHFVPNFIPVPIELAHNFNPAYLPPGIPINFVHTDKCLPPPNFVNIIPNHPPKHEDPQPTTPSEQELVVETPKPTEEPPKTIIPKTNIDIEKIVSKLEEAAKEQRFYEKQSNNKFTKPKRLNGFRKPEFVKRKPDNHVEEVKVDEVKSRDVELVPKRADYAKLARTSFAPKVNSNKYVRKNTVNTETCSRVSEVKSAPATPKRIQNKPLEPAPKALPNQWISVSRKKRKNKGAETDNELIEQEAAVVEEDGFEPYDVSLLEDVVVANTNIVPEVVTVVAEVKMEVAVEEKPTVPKTDAGEDFERLIKSLEEMEAKGAKKTKKSSQKTKRVIITDVDLSGTVERIEKSPTKVVKKDVVTAKKDITINKDVAKDKLAKIEITTNKEVIVGNDVTEQIATTDNKTSKEVVVDTDVTEKMTKKDITSSKEVVNAKDVVPEKMDVMVVKEDTVKLAAVKPEVVTKEIKPVTEVVAKETDVVKETGVVVEKIEDVTEKKRSKKKKRSSKAKSLQHADSTNTLSDTYDYLLSESILEHEKTNLEISEELDKIIQRGMYSSLEEKIKSLNITAANDGFFKTISLSKPEKSDPLISNDLSAVLKNTTNIFQGKRPSVDGQKLDLDTTTGSFLDVANTQKDPGIDYPITTAVKEWMTKTRETTPEVELLKSPSTILKELQPDDDSSEEVTVFSAENWSLSPENSFEQDLLECWDDEGVAVATPPTPIEIPVEPEVLPQKIDIGEDVVETYDSKYGKNEDFLKLKAEIEENKRTFPKHGNLPYKAICCTLM